MSNVHTQLLTDDASGRLVERRYRLRSGPRCLTVTGGDDGPHQASVVVRPGITTLGN